MISRIEADEIAQHRVKQIDNVAILAVKWGSQSDRSKFTAITEAIRHIQDELREWPNHPRVIDALCWEINQLKQAGEFFADALLEERR